jgi:hypothetical protein
LLKESLALADTISTKPKLATKAAKEAVNLGTCPFNTSCSHSSDRNILCASSLAYELPLSQGLEFEKRLFHLLFGTVESEFYHSSLSSPSCYADGFPFLE